jgi:uncharacterized protein
VATPLIVNVVELLRRPGNTKDVIVSVASADLTFDDARMTDDPIDVDVHLEALSNGISVHGHASATWAGECRRCLVPLRERMQIDVDELYQVVADSPDAYAIENDQINLLPMVRENLLVAIPLGPLCREDCPGFCPHCGTDLKTGSCTCSAPAVDDRWAALEALKGRLPETSE